MSYRVRITPTAVRHIETYGRWFAERREVPDTAQRWVDRTFSELATLEHHPRRRSLAPEDVFRDYEIRRIVIGYYVALFTIDDAAGEVHVLAFRHGHRQPISQELPHRLGRTPGEAGGSGPRKGENDPSPEK